MKTALVIGGGVVGGASAMALQSRGFAVTLLDDAAPISPASWGNAGHIAIEQVEPLASLATLKGAPGRLLSRRGGLSLPLSDAAVWAPFLARLILASGPRSFASGTAALRPMLARAMPAWTRFVAALSAPDMLRRDGHFIVWTDARRAKLGAEAWLRGNTGAADFRAVDAVELGWLNDLVRRPIGGALRCIGSGQIADPGDLAGALRTRLAAQGCNLRVGRARAVEIEAGTAWVRLHDDARLCADQIVIAAGVASRPLMESIGHRVPMIAERGYHVQYPSAGWPSDMPPVVFEDYSLIVTRFRSGVRAAGFVEFGAADRPADPAKWGHIRRHVRDIGLSLEGPGETWMGARPTLPDYLPAIGRSRRANTLLYAFGHQHLGLTLAPITGEIIAALANNQTATMPLEPFDLGRFERGWRP